MVAMLGQVVDSLQALVAVLAVTPVPLAVPPSPVNQRAKQVRLHPYVFRTCVFWIWKSWSRDWESRRVACCMPTGLCWHRAWCRIIVVLLGCRISFGKEGLDHTHCVVSCQGMDNLAADAALHSLGPSSGVVWKNRMWFVCLLTSLLHTGCWTEPQLCLHTSSRQHFGLAW